MVQHLLSSRDRSRPPRRRAAHLCPVGLRVHPRQPLRGQRGAVPSRRARDPDPRRRRCWGVRGGRGRQSPGPTCCNAVPPPASTGRRPNSPLISHGVRHPRLASSAPPLDRVTLCGAGERPRMYANRRPPHNDGACVGAPSSPTAGSVRRSVRLEHLHRAPQSPQKTVLGSHRRALIERCDAASSAVALASSDTRARMHWPVPTA